MPNQNTPLERELTLTFLEWFRDSNVDFWNESNAPEELALITSKILSNFVKPITDVFIKNGSKAEYEAAYRKYLANT